MEPSTGPSRSSRCSTETAHLGDPLEDIGWVTNPLRHREHQIPGVWERDEIVRAYAELTGSRRVGRRRPLLERARELQARGDRAHGRTFLRRGPRRPHVRRAEQLVALMFDLMGI